MKSYLINKSTAEFISPAVEQEFRTYIFDPQRKQTLWIMGVPILIILLNSVFDLFLLTESYYATISMYRIVYIILSAPIFYSTLKSKHFARLDWLVLGWLLLTAFLVLLVESSRPLTYSYHRFAVDFMFLVFAYLLVPTQLMNQIVVGITFTIPVIFMVSYQEYNIDSTSFATIFVTLLTANITGWFISRRYHILHREWYSAKMEKN